METTETTTELITLVQTSGLETTKQNQIAETLGIFFNKASEWDATIQSIVITGPEETGKMKMAKEGRLTLKNMRLEAEKIVKQKREEVKYRMSNDVLEDKLWLKAFQMMEATYKNLETKLEEKEKFAERWEAEQKERRTAERLLKLSEYSENDQYTDKTIVENLTDEVFESYYKTVKRQREEKIEAERIEEQKLIEQEKAEELERQAIRIENERLKQEAIEAERLADIQRKKQSEILAKEKAKLAEAKAKADAELKKQKEKADKLKAENDLKLQAEKLKTERLAEELKKQQDEIATQKRIEQDRLNVLARKEKVLAKAPDKAKLITFADSLQKLQLPELNSDEAKQILNDVKALLIKVTKYIKEKTENI